MNQQALEDFRASVWRYYSEHGRHDLPWRIAETSLNFSPYCIVVSEMMLQQTQVNRVIAKYHEFLAQFPDVQSLADATIGDVLVAWQGLGYNRRAKFLWQAARMVVSQYAGQFPDSQAQLVALPGIGVNTAGAIVSYAYCRPAVFVETNIRTVYIHHFFSDQANVADKDILELVGQTLPDDTTLCRAWYWALMDYGVHIKRTVGNKSRASRSYSRQSPFEGSRRQVRGAIIRELSKRPLSPQTLSENVNDGRLNEVLAELIVEGMVSETSEGYRLS